MPKTKCLDLWLGSEKDLVTSVRKIDNKYKWVKYQQVNITDEYGEEKKVGMFLSEQIMLEKNVTLAQEWYKSNLSTIADFNNVENLNEKAHLGMLNLDFRPPTPMLQQFFTSSPNGINCNLLIRVVRYKSSSNF